MAPTNRPRATRFLRASGRPKWLWPRGSLCIALTSQASESFLTPHRGQPESEKHKDLEAIADLKIIGHVSSAKNGVTLISKADQSIPIEAQGWGHFKN